MLFSKKQANKDAKADFKAKLQHKLYLARIDPSQNYDISNCNLEIVPSGTFELCKVFRKETLLMQCNRLQSILGGGTLKSLSGIIILNLHANKLDSLPPDIIHLTSLKELDLQGNDIQKLPDEIVKLNQLSTLNISKNQLKCLPDSMGELENLSFLDLSYNKDFQKLPKSLGLVQKLSRLRLDGLKLVYPSEDILTCGTRAITDFLANEYRIELHPKNYIAELEVPDVVTSVKSEMLSDTNDFEIQEQRQSAYLGIKKSMKQQRKQNILTNDEVKVNNLKLLDDLAQKRINIDKEFEKFQHKKDINRLRLLSYIHNAQKGVDNVIEEFFNTNKKKERQTQAELLKLEKKEKLQLLSYTHAQRSLHHTKDTLEAMKKSLEKELLSKKKLAEYTALKECHTQSLLSLEKKNNALLSQMMLDQEKNKQDLVIRLRDDQLLQKAVVAASLEQSDARSWTIVQQVNLVQLQLAALTNIELEKRNLEISQQINAVAEKRVTLGGILVNLLKQQEERKQQLFEIIKHIEEQRYISDLSKKDDSFWLLQYQNLTEARPQGLLETLDPNLLWHIATAGVLHCLPFLASLSSPISELKNNHLISAGIEKKNDRDAIMLAVENYLAEKKLKSFKKHAPSAPLSEESCNPLAKSLCKSVPTAPAECVVCMDFDCEVIFLPCGHLCCCVVCTEALSGECPMCRTTIQRKIRISV